MSLVSGTCLFVVGYESTDGADPIYCGACASDYDVDGASSYIKLIPTDDKSDAVIAFHVTDRRSTMLCCEHADIVRGV